MHRFSDNVKTVSALIPQVLTADSSITAIDTLGYSGVQVEVHVGNSGDTLSATDKIELELQDGDTTTTAACADADITGAVTGTNTGTFAVIDAPAEDSAVFSTQYLGGKRYIKPVVNLTGTHTNGTPVGVVVHLFNPKTLPAA